MRRLILFCAIGLGGMMLTGQLAVAQLSSGGFVVPRPLLSDPPSTGVARPLPSFHVNRPAETPASPADTSRGGEANDGNAHGDDGRRGNGGDVDHGHGSHHHSHHGGTGPWFVWPPVVYPWQGNVGYIPRFPSYTNLGLPYYIDPALSAWSPIQQPMAQPSAGNVPAPAPAVPLSTLDSIKSKIRVTNAATKARAGKFVGYGDANFKKQSYLSAAERYKDASRMAPDLADAYVRQGFAYIAMSNYDSAARVFHRGLLIRSDWNGSPFRLDQIYDDDQISKTAHLESLAKAAEDNPLDGNLLMLLGMMLYFDGQVERSEPFFAAAAKRARTRIDCSITF